MKRENIFIKAHKLKISNIISSLNFGKMFEFEDKDYTSTIKLKSGRTEVSCNCANGTVNCNNLSICSHKIKIIVNEYLEKNNLKVIKNDNI